MGGSQTVAESSAFVLCADELCDREGRWIVIYSRRKFRCLDGDDDNKNGKLIVIYVKVEAVCSPVDFNCR